MAGYLQMIFSSSFFIHNALTILFIALFVNLGTLKYPYLSRYFWFDISKKCFI